MKAAIGILVGALLLSACGPSVAPATLTPAVVTLVPTVTPPPPPPANTPIPTPAQAATAAPAATEASRFPPVTKADWQTGPVTATVTLVEYGDYQ